MRTRRTLFVCSAALVVLGACGTSEGASNGAAATTTAAAATTTTTAAAATTTTASTVAVDAWADDFCSGFKGWLDEIKAASENVGAGITPGDIEGGKTAISDLFGAASDATQTLIGELEAAGAPDIDNGQGLVDDLTAKFEAFDQAALDAQADVEALDSVDAAAFAVDADELTTRFQDEVQTVGDSFAEIDADYPSPELTTAINSSCGF